MRATSDSTMLSISDLQRLIAEFDGKKEVDEYATLLKTVHDECLASFKAFDELPYEDKGPTIAAFHEKQLLYLEYESKIISHLNFQLNNNEHGANAMLTEDIPLAYKDHANLLMPVLTLQKIEEPSKREMLAISCAIDEVIARAKSLSNTKFDEKTIIAYVQSILDDSSKVAWDFFFPDEPSLKALQNFLMKRANQLPAIEPEQHRNPFASRRENDGCPRCGGAHKLHRCELFKIMHFAARWKFVTNEHLCENCFDSYHSTVQCPIGACKKCNVQHNSLLCKRSNL